MLVFGAITFVLWTGAHSVVRGEMTGGQLGQFLVYAVYVAVAAIAFWFHAHYGFGLNASPSLPHRLFLIHKGEMPSRGDFVAFRWAGGGPYPAGVTFIKVLAGMPGDASSLSRKQNVL